MNQRYIILLVLFGLAFIIYMYNDKKSLFEGFDYSITYKAADNTIAKITSNTNTSNSITVTNADESTTVYQTSVGDTTHKFYNPSGAYATVSNNSKTITIVGANGSTKIYTSNNDSNDDSNNDDSNNDNSNDYSIIAIGDNKTRRKVCLEKSKSKWATIIHPLSIISKNL